MRVRVERVRVIPRAAIQAVVAGSARQRVIAAFTGNRVVEFTAENRVVSVASRDLYQQTTDMGKDRLRHSAKVDGICAGTTLDDQRLDQAGVDAAERGIDDPAHDHGQLVSGCRNNQ